jgi:hypothetical protein
MQPIFFTIGARLPLMIIPDSQAHVDGHPVLTYTYSVYKNSKKHSELVNIESNLHLTKNTNPDYMGYITFEQPGRLFTYTADGQQDLSSDEVREIIEMITHYRDTPAMWTL